MNIEEVREVLEKISAAPSALEFKYCFEAVQLTISQDSCGGREPTSYNAGFHIRVLVYRKDTNTGEYDWGPSRWNHTPQETTEKGVAMTAWLCLEQYVKHELMESFLFCNVRIMDPHNSLDDMAYPNKLERN